MGGREGAMTCRIGPLGAGFEPGSPAVRTVASTHGVGDTFIIGINSI